VEDFEFYEDEYADEEEEEEEEGTNRTFIFLVAGLGSLLALAICAFVAWALFINPRMTADRVAQNEAVEATNEAILAEAGAVPSKVPPEATEVETAEAPPAVTEPVTPTDTPQPTPTQPPTATAVPATATPGEVAGALTATPGPTATPKPAGKTGVPKTGIGVLGASALTVGLLFLLIAVRRIRRTV